MSIRSDYKPISIIEDVAVPVAQLENYVRALDEVFAKFNTHGAYYAHASAGVLHVRPLLNLRTVEGVQAVEAIGDAALKLCQTMGGAMSGEHGDGYERTHYNEALFGREVYQTFCAIKDVFDPRGIMNPGKKVRADDKHALKLGPDTHLKPIATTFLYRGDGDIAHLSEECNGAGVCRKLDGGVMCPSYRVTRDEMHSTRGRANLLRHLMRAPAEDPFNQTEDAKIDNVKAALDLCLSCKACLGECGSRVDMAKMKSDFTQMYFDRRGTPLRARILGHIAALSRLATLTPLTARMANALINTRALKRALRLADRPLPAFALEPFDVWWRKRTTPAYQNSAQTVALFIDTFTRYNHPHIGVAAVNVLEALGYRVVVPQSVCCGRPLVSQGQPRAAKKLAQQNADILAPFIQQNIPVVALEPSCITMLNEDTADLVGTSLGVRAIEDFVAEVLASSPEHAEGVASTNPALLDRSASALSHSGNTVLLHGHCHQKASYGVNGTLSALRQLGYDAHTFDSTCCGMAGAFGFEAEHAGLSQRVGELGVLPTVRAANSDTLVAAAGTSCRQQIGELAPRESLHPIELIARAMFDSHAETLSH
jgi:Fe-S oxidoreductase